MTVKEFFNITKLRGNVTLNEIVFNQINPRNSLFIGTNPYEINHVENFNFNDLSNLRFKYFENMEIVSMCANTYDDKYTLNIGCKKSKEK